MTENMHVNRLRQENGFLTIEQTTALASRGVIVFDPCSTLISSDVTLGLNVVLWPGVILQAGKAGKIIIGDAVRLYPGTRVVATNGRIRIGAQTEIGEEGGFTVKAEQHDSAIEIGEGVRLLGGGSLMLSNSIGHGAQVLGPIRVQACSLAGGETYREPDPDKRGAVLKGSGVARQIMVPTGMVIQAFGVFSEADMQKQSYFHPKLEA